MARRFLTAFPAIAEKGAGLDWPYAGWLTDVLGYAEHGGYNHDGQPIGEDDAETQMFRKAVQVVAESQKASTSYLQRQLRVGYNNAARLIERMEKEGMVSAPDHVGRREVLVDPEGRPLV
jgi:S-DNA-T family DNA segregation ATPase FtsK/SpoIIIE